MNESDDDGDGSVLSEISNESTYFESKIIYQRRALLRKNATLQWRQKWTNLCQIFTPIIGLLNIIIVQQLAKENLDKLADKVIYIPFPFLFGLNY